MIKYLKKLQKQRQECLLAGSALDPFNHNSYSESKRIAILKARADYERELYELNARYNNVYSATDRRNS